MLEDRKIFESKLEAQLAQWKAEIDVLKAKAKRTEVDAMVNYDKVIENLQHKHAEAGTRLQQLKTASDEAWESLKTSTEKAWEEIKGLFQGSDQPH